MGQQYKDKETDIKKLRIERSNDKGFGIQITTYQGSSSIEQGGLVVHPRQSVWSQVMQSLLLILLTAAAYQKYFLFSLFRIALVTWEEVPI